MRTSHVTARGYRCGGRGRQGLFGAALVCLAFPILLAGCDGSDRVIPSGPTGQPVLPWLTPIDRDALLAAMPAHRADDLSGYNFAVMLVVQNFLESSFAVTLEVNGQDIERRTVNGLTQEIFDIPESLIVQTEQNLGVSSKDADPRLMGHSCPFVVRLKNYVAADGYVIPDSSFVLAPQDVFENMIFSDGTSENDPAYIVKGSFYADAVVVCPGSFAIAIHKTHIDFVELDREFIPVNEPAATPTDTNDLQANDTGDNTDSFFKRFYDGLTFHPQTIEALKELGMLWLLPFLHQPPVVAIVNPANGASFPGGSTITVMAAASDPDGVVTRVEFFANDVKIGEATSEPYSIAWSVEGTGEYKLTAKATDNDGATTTSDAVTALIGLGPKLEVAPVSLAFGPGETTATVRVTNAGTGLLEVSNVHSVKPWIAASPTSGGQGDYIITVNPAGLSAGTFNGSVIFVSNGGNIELPVSMQVK
jgi:hypothetical protein